MTQAATLLPGEPAYTITARVLHWLTAALVVLLIVGGIVMTRMPEGPAQILVFDLHRSAGWLILPLIIIRLAYRLRNTPGPLPAEIAPIQRFAAEATHWLLYAGLIVQPFIGWLGMSTYGVPVRLFWLVDVPNIWTKNEALSEKLFVLHDYIGYGLAALIAVHVSAALFHHFVLRDNVLMRMTRGA